MAIKLPSATPGGAVAEMDAPFRLVVVGANGSGKTRFGVWLEEQNQADRVVHRLSAQKALSLPERAAMKTLDQAEKDLLYGRHDQHASAARKVHDRWGGNPTTHLLSDYESLVALLFANDAERDRQHTRETRKTKQYVVVPESPIDQIVAMWNYLMPHRSISFDDGKVLVGQGTTKEYHAKEMSDGERVTLYLLGQCLVAPSGSMLIIDEPELHLHRALMDKLWNTVEQKCPDKTIVYITHDLEFAASRSDARKIWIKDFDGVVWTWETVPDDRVVPEALILEIIGSRKPILFCEGDRGGLDHTLYQLCFPDVHVLPRGGADKVIESTKALRANPDLHTLQPRGVVDRDVRSDTELKALEGHGVSVIRFAEVENVLCTEEVVRAVAAQLKLGADDIVVKVRDFIIASLQDELDTQVTLRAAQRIRYQLSCYSAPNSDPSSLGKGVTDLVATVDATSITARERATIEGAIATANLNTVLEVYNRKSMLDRVAPIFGLKPGELPELVIRMLKSPDSGPLVSSLRSVLPPL